jgi:hypothetical protein
MKSAEHNLQAALFRWAAFKESVWPELRWMFAIPNGGQRHPAVAMRLKAEGVKRGVPDVCLPVPRGIWKGLYAEAKIKPNKCTPEQTECIEFLREQGYCVFIFHDLDYAIEMITRYLKVGKAELEKELLK